MENPNSNKQGIEDNMLLTMFDSSSDTNQDALNQRIAFLDVVRASSIELQNVTNSKIFGPVFHMLRTGNSIQLIVASYKLLVDLEKMIPHRRLTPPKLVVTEEMLIELGIGMVSPYCRLNATVVGEAGNKHSGGPLDPSIFSEPKWKLEIVVQYLWKYITKPSTRTRRSNGFTGDTTFDGALKCFSNNTGTKSIIKKIGADVVQLLLAHGFQAQLSILSERNANDNIGGDREEGAGAHVDLCQAFISAFDSLRSTDSDMEILSIGKEALFTAATAISMKPEECKYQH